MAKVGLLDGTKVLISASNAEALGVEKGEDGRTLDMDREMYQAICNCMKDVDYLQTCTPGKCKVCFVIKLKAEAKYRERRILSSWRFHSIVGKCEEWLKNAELRGEKCCSLPPDVDAYPPAAPPAADSPHKHSTPPRPLTISKTMYQCCMPPQMSTTDKIHQCSHTPPAARPSSGSVPTSASSVFSTMPVQLPTAVTPTPHCTVETPLESLTVTVRFVSPKEDTANNKLCQDNIAVGHHHEHTSTVLPTSNSGHKSTTTSGRSCIVYNEIDVARRTPHPVSTARPLTHPFTAAKPGKYVSPSLRTSECSSQCSLQDAEQDSAFATEPSSPERMNKQVMNDMGAPPKASVEAISAELLGPKRVSGILDF